MTENNHNEWHDPNLRKELLRVRAQANEIDKMHLRDDSSQRVVLTLPKSLVHLAQFVAIMESRPMPEGLDFWQYVSGIGADDPVPTKNAKLMMRAWMEEEIMTRVHVAMLQLEAKAKELDEGDGMNLISANC